MSASPEFASHVGELLAPLGRVTSGMLFGGFGFKNGGKQFAMILGNTLYFCVNDQTRQRYEDKGMLPFSYTTKKGRVTVRKYFAVPPELLDEPQELIAWARQAVVAAQSA